MMVRSDGLTIAFDLKRCSSGVWLLSFAGSRARLCVLPIARQYQNKGWLQLMRSRLFCVKTLGTTVLLGVVAVAAAFAQGQAPAGQAGQVRTAEQQFKNINNNAMSTEYSLHLKTEKLIKQCRFVNYQPPKITALAFSHQSNSEEETPESLLLAIGRSNGDIDIWSPLYEWVHKIV